jgi:alkylation response protein AidB-like acyl-CoA dehydrogenase
MADDATIVHDRTSQLLDEIDPRTAPVEKFRSRQFDLGLAWISFPEGRGGLGLPPNLQREIDRRLAEAGASPPGAREFFGLTMAGPTVVTHGTDELRDRLLRRMFTGEESWCQLFSEPGSGSDLAGLATRAVRDGDEWVITGQKVWNTLAHIADRGMLVARTDPEAPKHKGLTYFALNMHADGVEVRPLRQMTGEAEFNEVYLTEVRVPDGDRVGDVGEGWRVAMTTLSNERTSIGGGTGPPTRGSGAIAEAVRIWSDGHRQDPVARDRLMRLWIESEVLRLTNMRASQNRKAGNPGPEGSIAKLMFAEVNQRVYDLCIDLMGPTGQIGYDYTMRRAETLGLVGPSGSARKMFIRSRANSIEGGTSEIQRNILGERILGLPGDVRVDKELPWSKVPRS